MCLYVLPLAHFTIIVTTTESLFFFPYPRAFVCKWTCACKRDIQLFFHYLTRIIFISTGDRQRVRRHSREVRKGNTQKGEQRIKG